MSYEREMSYEWVMNVKVICITNFVSCGRKGLVFLHLSEEFPLTKRMFKIQDHLDVCLNRQPRHYAVLRPNPEYSLPVSKLTRWRNSRKSPKSSPQSIAERQSRKVNLKIHEIFLALRLRGCNFIEFQPPIARLLKIPNYRITFDVRNETFTKIQKRCSNPMNFKREGERKRGREGERETGETERNDCTVLKEKLILKSHHMPDNRRENA